MQPSSSLNSDLPPTFFYKLHPTHDKQWYGCPEKKKGWHFFSRLKLAQMSPTSKELHKCQIHLKREVVTTSLLLLPEVNIYHFFREKKGWYLFLLTLKWCRCRSLLISKKITMTDVRSKFNSWKKGVTIDLSWVGWSIFKKVNNERYGSYFFFLDSNWLRCKSLLISKKLT